METKPLSPVDLSNSISPQHILKSKINLELMEGKRLFGINFFEKFHEIRNDIIEEYKKEGWNVKLTGEKLDSWYEFS